MASLSIHLKSHHRKTFLKISPNLTVSRHFSSEDFSSSSDNSDENVSKNPNLSSYINELKSKLKQQDPRPYQSTPQNFSNPPKAASVDEIMKNLSEYRQRSSVPEPGSPSPMNLFKTNMANSTPNPKRNSNSDQVSFDTIRASLRQLRASQDEKRKTGTGSGSDHFLLNKYKENFKLGPSMAESGRKVYGGSTEGLPTSVFGREMEEREKKKRGEVGNENGEDEMRKSELFKMYSHGELGERLRGLRPESTKKEGWFSIAELNERLKKLREIEEKQSVAGIEMRELRKSYEQIKKQEFARFNILSQLSGTPSFMLHSPKEHLVEKYFHPDNMSSEEKLKLELNRVRDEFKMHESDCGSTRVQIAQLTTEISHLSSVLHKKDKHSRRGLLAKVQQRKKLLKYLRRTDWDSYCLVLSKLSLRDNPDYKN